MKAILPCKNMTIGWLSQTPCGGILTHSSLFATAVAENIAFFLLLPMMSICGILNCNLPQEFCCVSIAESSAYFDLILKKNFPKEIKVVLYKSLLSHIHPLKAEFQPISITPPLLRNNPQMFYHLSNSSIIKTEEGYDLICRAVNYRNSGGYYTWFDPDDRSNTVKTKNFLVHLDRNLRVLSQQEIIEELPRQRTTNGVNAIGLEDCRLVHFDKATWFSCTTTDTNPKGFTQMSLCKLESGQTKEIHVESLTPLKGPDPFRHEKNWLPIVHNDELHFIYSFSPFVLNKPDIKTGAWKTVLQYDPPLDFSLFRGSAAPVPFDEGYLVMVHEVIRPETYFYLHRFVFLDSNFMIQKLSRPFTFQHKGVEYCCGMAIDHSGKELIMAVSKEDCEAALCITNLDTVRRMLVPLCE